MATRASSRRTRADKRGSEKSESESSSPGSTATGTCSVLSISAGDQARQLKISTELSTLESKNPGKNHDLASCLSSVDLWASLCEDSFESILHLRELFRRLIKNVSRSILSGTWLSVPAESRDRLRSCMNTIASQLQNEDLGIEARHCLAGCYLLEKSTWQEEHINKILKQPVSIENVNKLWEVEGWIFIETRIEVLCKLAVLEHLARLTEACVMKGLILYPDNQAEVSPSEPNEYEMPREKFYEIAAVFAITLYKFNSVQDNPFLRLEPYLTVPLVTQTAIRLCASDSPHRVQPSWKNWKYAKIVASALVLRKLELANESVTDLVELKELFKFYTKLKYFIAQDYKDKLGVEGITSLLNSLPFREKNSSLMKAVLEFSISDCFNGLTKSAANNDYVIAYADSILELGGTTEPVLTKVVELYVNELTEEVRHLQDLQVQGDKEATNTFSQIIARRFESLAHHFEFVPQICFEIMVSGFSLNPTREVLDRISALVESPKEGTAPVNVRLKISGSMHAKAKVAMSVFVDLTNLMQGIRAARLTCFRDSWTKFKTVCENHLATRGEDILGVNDLPLAKPTDFSAYIGMKPAYDENDTGYEAGYCPVEDDEEPEDGPVVPQRKPKKIREPAYRMRMFLEGSAAGTSATTASAPSFRVNMKNKQSKVKNPNLNLRQNVAELIVKKMKVKGLKSVPQPKNAKLKDSASSSGASTSKAEPKIPSRKSTKEKKPRGRPAVNVKRGNSSKSNPKPERSLRGRTPKSKPESSAKRKSSSSRSKTKLKWPPADLVRVTSNGDSILPRFPGSFPSLGSDLEYSDADRRLLEIPYVQQPTLLANIQSRPVRLPNYRESHEIASHFRSPVEELLAYAETHNHFPGDERPAYSQIPDVWTNFFTGNLSAMPMPRLMSQVPGAGTASETEAMDDDDQNEVLPEYQDQALDIDIDAEAEYVSMLQKCPHLEAEDPPFEFQCPDSPGIQVRREDCSNCMGSMLDQLSETSLSESDYSRALASTEDEDEFSSPESPAGPGTHRVLSDLTGAFVREYDSSKEVQDCDDTYADTDADISSFSGFSNDESDEMSGSIQDLDLDEFFCIATPENADINILEVLSEVTGDVVTVNLLSDENPILLSETTGEFFQVNPVGLLEDLVPCDLPDFDGFTEPDSPVSLPSPSHMSTSTVPEFPEVEILPEDDDDEPVFLGVSVGVRQNVNVPVLPKPRAVVALTKKIKICLKKLTSDEIAKYKRVPGPPAEVLAAAVAVPDADASHIVKTKAVQRRKSCPSPSDTPSEKKPRPESAETRRSTRISRAKTWDDESSSLPNSPLSSNVPEKREKAGGRVRKADTRKSHKRKQQEVPVEMPVLENQLNHIHMENNNESEAVEVEAEISELNFMPMPHFLLGHCEEKIEEESEIRVSPTAKVLKENGVSKLPTPEPSRPRSARRASMRIRNPSSDNDNGQLPAAKRPKTMTSKSKVNVNPEQRVHQLPKTKKSKNPPKPKVIRQASTESDILDDESSEEPEDEDPIVLEDDDPEFMPSDSELDLDEDEEIDNFVLTDEEDDDQVCSLVKPKLDIDIKSKSKDLESEEPFRKWEKIVPEVVEPDVEDVHDFEVDPLALEDYEPDPEMIDLCSDSESEPETEVDEEPMLEDPNIFISPESSQDQYEELDDGRSLNRVLGIPETIDVTYADADENRAETMGIRAMSNYSSFVQIEPMPVQHIPQIDASEDMIIPDLPEIEITDHQPETVISEDVIILPIVPRAASPIAPPAEVEEVAQREVGTVAAVVPVPVIYDVESPTSDSELEVSKTTSPKQESQFVILPIMTEQEKPKSRSATLNPDGGETMQSPEILRTTSPKTDKAISITPMSQPELLSVTNSHMDIRVTTVAVRKPEPESESLPRMTTLKPEIQEATQPITEHEEPESKPATAEPEIQEANSPITEQEYPESKPATAEPEIQVVSPPITEQEKPGASPATPEPEIQETTTPITEQENPGSTPVTPKPDIQVVTPPITEHEEPGSRLATPKPEIQHATPPIIEQEKPGSIPATPEPEIQETIPPITEQEKPGSRPATPKPEIQEPNSPITGHEKPGSRPATPNPEIQAATPPITEHKKPGSGPATPKPEIQEANSPITGHEKLESRPATPKPEIQEVNSPITEIKEPESKPTSPIPEIQVVTPPITEQDNPESRLATPEPEIQDPIPPITEQEKLKSRPATPYPEIQEEIPPLTEQESPGSRPATPNPEIGEKMQNLDVPRAASPKPEMTIPTIAISKPELLSVTTSAVAVWKLEPESESPTAISPTTELPEVEIPNATLPSAEIAMITPKPEPEPEFLNNISPTNQMVIATITPNSTRTTIQQKRVPSVNGNPGCRIPQMAPAPQIYLRRTSTGWCEAYDVVRPTRAHPDPDPSPIRQKINSKTAFAGSEEAGSEQQMLTTVAASRLAGVQPPMPSPLSPGRHRPILLGGKRKKSGQHLPEGIDMPGSPRPIQANVSNSPGFSIALTSGHYGEPGPAHANHPNPSCKVLKPVTPIMEQEKLMPSPTAPNPESEVTIQSLDVPKTDSPKPDMLILTSPISKPELLSVTSVHSNVEIRVTNSTVAVWKPEPESDSLIVISPATELPNAIFLSAERAMITSEPEPDTLNYISPTKKISRQRRTPNPARTRQLKNTTTKTTFPRSKVPVKKQLAFTSGAASRRRGQVPKPMPVFSPPPYVPHKPSILCHKRKKSGQDLPEVIPMLGSPGPKQARVSNSSSLQTSVRALTQNAISTAYGHSCEPGPAYAYHTHVPVRLEKVSIVRKPVPASVEIESGHPKQPKTLYQLLNLVEPDRVGSPFSPSSPGSPSQESGSVASNGLVSVTGIEDSLKGIEKQCAGRVTAQGRKKTVRSLNLKSGQLLRQLKEQISHPKLTISGLNVNGVNITKPEEDAVPIISAVDIVPLGSPSPVNVSSELDNNSVNTKCPDTKVEAELKASDAVELENSQDSPPASTVELSLDLDNTSEISQELKPSVSAESELSISQDSPSTPPPAKESAKCPKPPSRFLDLNQPPRAVRMELSQAKKKELTPTQPKYSEGPEVTTCPPSFNPFKPDSGTEAVGQSKWMNWFQERQAEVLAKVQKNEPIKLEPASATDSTSAAASPNPEPSIEPKSEIESPKKSSLAAKKRSHSKSKSPHKSKSKSKSKKTRNSSTLHETPKPEPVEENSVKQEENLEIVEVEAGGSDEREMPKLVEAVKSEPYYGNNYPDALPPRLEPYYGCLL